MIRASPATSDGPVPIPGLSGRPSVSETPTSVEETYSRLGSMTKMNDLERQRELRRLRDETLNTPNCPACLHRMEPAKVDGDLMWACPGCGTLNQP